MHTAEELFLGAGPRPRRVVEASSPPPGSERRNPGLRSAARCGCCAPLLNPARVGTDEEVRCGEAFVLRVEAGRDHRKAGLRRSRPGSPPAHRRLHRDERPRHAHALGPYLVTPDEIGNPYDLDAVVRVNGEECGLRQFGEPSAEVRGGHRAPFVRRPDPSRRHHRVPSRPLPGDPPGRCHRVGDLENRNAADARGLSLGATEGFIEGKRLLGFVSHTRLLQPGVFTNAREG